MKTVEERMAELDREASSVYVIERHEWGRIRERIAKQLTQQAAEWQAEAERLRSEERDSWSGLVDKLKAEEAELAAEKAELTGKLEMRQAMIEGQRRNIVEGNERFRQIREYYQNAMFTIRDLLNIILSIRPEYFDAKTQQHVAKTKLTYEETFKDNPYSIFSKTDEEKAAEAKERPEGVGVLKDFIEELLAKHYDRDPEATYPSGFCWWDHSVVPVVRNLPAEAHTILVSNQGTYYSAGEVFASWECEQSARYYAKLASR